MIRKKVHASTHWNNDTDAVKNHCYARPKNSDMFASVKFWLDAYLSLLFRASAEEVELGKIKYLLKYV